MLSLSSERIISFSEAAAMLPKRRGGKRPHVATLYRWSQRGCRGVKLESVQVGGTKCTSVEALQRFCNRLSGSGTSTTTSPAGSPLAHRRLAEVDRQLDAAGF